MILNINNRLRIMRIPVNALTSEGEGGKGGKRGR